MSIRFILYFDWISLLFFRVVVLISGSIMFYSKSYIKGDGSETRFLFLVLLFVGSIFFLVFRLNIIRILLG